MDAADAEAVILPASAEMCIRDSLRSIGMEPDKLNDRERWLLLARMLPLVENNFNLCELGQRRDVYKRQAMVSR